MPLPRLIGRPGWAKYTPTATAVAAVAWSSTSLLIQTVESFDAFASIAAFVIFRFSSLRVTLGRSG